MQIDIVGGSYKNKYVSVNVQRTINWYIHKELIEGEDDKYKDSLQPFAGFGEFADTTKTRQRRIFVARTLTEERCFVVADNYLIEVADDGTITDRGQMTDMTDNSSTVFMEVNGAGQIMIAHSSASYIFDMPTNVLTKITDAQFPGGVISLSYIQGIFLIVTGEDATAGTEGRVWYSDVNNGLSWVGTSVFTPTASADKTVAAIVWRDDIYLFGSETIETYVFDGTTPFAKQGRDTVLIGLTAIETLTVFHDGIIFLGKTRKGQTKVYFYNGQTAVPISTAGVDWALNNPTSLLGRTWDQLTLFTWDKWADRWGVDLADTYAEIQYSKDGHIFYYMTVPAIHTTYVFDIITKEWVERQSYDPTLEVDLEFRGKYMVNFKGYNLFTDTNSGKVLKEDFGLKTELDSPMTFTRISKIMSEEKKNISIYSFELDTTTGAGLVEDSATTANIGFYYSRDGGNSYSDKIDLSTGIFGDYTARPRSFKLGTARDWTFKLIQTDPADISINSAIIHGVVDGY